MICPGEAGLFPPAADTDNKSPSLYTYLTDGKGRGQNTRRHSGTEAESCSSVAPRRESTLPSVSSPFLQLWRAQAGTHAHAHARATTRSCAKRALQKYVNASIHFLCGGAGVDVAKQKRFIYTVIPWLRCSGEPQALGDAAFCLHSDTRLAQFIRTIFRRIEPRPRCS